MKQMPLDTYTVSPVSVAVYRKDDYWTGRWSMWVQLCGHMCGVKTGSQPCCTCSCIFNSGCEPCVTRKRLLDEIGK